MAQDPYQVLTTIEVRAFAISRAHFILWLFNFWMINLSFVDVRHIVNGNRYELGGIPSIVYQYPCSTWVDRSGLLYLGMGVAFDAWPCLMFAGGAIAVAGTLAYRARLRPQFDGWYGLTLMLLTIAWLFVSAMTSAQHIWGRVAAATILILMVGALIVCGIRIHRPHDKVVCAVWVSATLSFGQCVAAVSSDTGLPRSTERSMTLLATACVAGALVLASGWIMQKMRQSAETR